jgi:hypothetical protein
MDSTHGRRERRGYRELHDHHPAERTGRPSAQPDAGDPPDAEAIWLDSSISKEHALSLLGPYPAELMAALPASSRVNSVRNDDAGLLHADDALAT